MKSKNNKITLSDLENSLNDVIGSSTKFIKKNPTKSFFSFLPIVSTLLSGVYFEGKRRGKAKRPKVEIWD